MHYIPVLTPGYLLPSHWIPVLHGVMDMDIGHKGNDSGSKHPNSVYLSHFQKYTFKLDQEPWLLVGLKLFFM